MSEPAHTTQTLPHGVQITHMDGEVVVFYLPNVKRETIDEWIDQVIAIGDERQDNIRFLHDLSDVGIMLTSYARRRVQDVFQAHPDAQGKVALLVSDGFFARVVKLFMDRDMTRAQPGVAQKLLFDRDAALAWLREAD